MSRSKKSVGVILDPTSRITSDSCVLADGKGMEDLQEFYRSAVGDQVAALERAIILFESGVSNAEEKIRQLAHTLKGSGSSYGFPEVSEAAAIVERSAMDSLPSTAWKLVDILKTITDGADSNTILVIEDDPLISHFIQAELAGDAHRIVQCFTLAEASRFLDTSPAPALILLDLFLPDGDGRSLLHTIRRSDTMAEVPVVVMSGATSESRNHEVQALSASAFISKPFQPGELSAVLADILGSDDHGMVASRVELTDAYRLLTTGGGTATIACVLPEFDQIGSHHYEITELVSQISEHIGGNTTIGTWEPGEIAIVSRDPEDIIAKQLEEARLTFMNSSPSSFSTAILTEVPGASLIDTYARARRGALDIQANGGNAVQVVDISDHPKRVLLAEDDTLTAALIIHRLEREGYEVEHYGDGSSAIDAVSRDRFGLVVLDVQMPGANGFDVLSKIRDDHTMKDVPIVMLTAVGGERDVVRGFELGADDYILKPFSPAELTARLKRFTRA